LLYVPLVQLPHAKLFQMSDGGLEKLLPRGKQTILERYVDLPLFDHKRNK
jgi:hypothetical protein